MRLRLAFLGGRCAGCQVARCRVGRCRVPSWRVRKLPGAQVPRCPGGIKYMFAFDLCFCFYLCLCLNKGRTLLYTSIPLFYKFIVSYRIVLYRACLYLCFVCLLQREQREDREDRETEKEKEKGTRILYEYIWEWDFQTTDECEKRRNLRACLHTR